MALAAGGAAAAIALAEAFAARVAGVDAVPAVARTALAAVVLFGVAGWAPARLLVPPAWRAERPLFVLPLGAACASLALAALGLLHVPMKAALAIVLTAGIAGALLVRRAQGGNEPRARAPDWPVRIALPLFVAMLVALVSLLPVFRSGVATVHGQNGDAVIAVGVAELLKVAPPTAVREELPVDRMPIVWRSKVPIYSALAAVSTLAGQDPVAAFSTVMAVLYGLFALGMFLFARRALGFGPLAATAAAGLVALDRIAVYVAIHPYYNQLWGLFALPLVFLFGWHALAHPSRRGFAALGLLLALALFAYPLLLPFPAVFLAVAGWRVWRTRRAEGRPLGWLDALHLPGPRRRPVPWIVAGVVAVPVVAVLVRGVAEKALSAAAVLAPWTDLAGWSGDALPYLPFGRFVGVEGPVWLVVAGAAAIFAAAWVGLRAVRARELAVALGWVVAMGLLVGVYFYARGKGQLFYFKALAFTGPLVVALAVGGLAAGWSAARSRGARAAWTAAFVLLVLSLANGARAEIDETYDHATPAVLELRTWDRELPPGASVRIDVPPSGYQLWSWYMLASRPVCALDPLSGFFPHPPRGVKADFVLTRRGDRYPFGAIGGPVRANRTFRLYRLHPDVLGEDVSSRRLIYDQSRITY